MAESTASLTYNDMAAMVGVVFSFGATVGSFNADQAEQVAVAIRRGYRRFLYPPPLKGEDAAHRWSFLHPVTTFTTNAPYSTGTLTIVDGVVTLASGTFPSWAAQGILVVNGTGYDVNTRDSGTQVTLHDTSLDVSAGASYTLYNSDIDAPDNFGALEDRPTFVTPTSQNRMLEVIDEAQLRVLRASNSNVSGRPQVVAVRTKALVTTGQRFEFLLWPAPDAAYVVSYTYEVLPDLFTTTQYPLGGSAHAETILASAMAVAAEMLMDQEMIQRRYADFMERLRASVWFDRQGMAPRRVLTDRELRTDDMNTNWRGWLGHRALSASYG